MLSFIKKFHRSVYLVNNIILLLLFVSIIGLYLWQVSKQITVDSQAAGVLNRFGIQKIVLQPILNVDKQGRILEYTVVPKIIYSDQKIDIIKGCHLPFVKLKEARTVTLKLSQYSYTIKDLPFFSGFSNEDYADAVNPIIACIVSKTDKN